MSNNNTSTKTPNLGDIGMIRDILMGQHINSFETQLEDTQNRINALGTALNTEIKTTRESLDEKFSIQLEALATQSNNRFSELAQSTEQRFAALQQQFEERSIKIEQQLAENLAQLQQKIATQSQEDKHSLGLMLVELGKQLMK